MAINFGSDACNAIKALRGNEHFKTFRADLQRLIVKHGIEMGSLSDPTSIMQRSGYTKALFEMWRAIEAMSTERMEAQVPAPSSNVAFDDTLDDELPNTPLAVPEPDKAAALGRAPAPKK